MKNIINIGIAVLLLSFLSACSKDRDVASMLMRDTDRLDFEYGESQATFTVRTNGAWSIDLNEADWISVDISEGVGNGEVQVVTATASRNVGDAREGIVKLIGGGREALIYVGQEEGKVIFGTPSFTSGFLPNTPLEDAQIVIPYQKGAVEEAVAVSVQVNGAGAGSIQVPAINVDMSAENGEIRIPLSGTPGLEGALSFTIRILGQELLVNTSVREQGNPDPVGTIYLSQNFDLLVLGGDHVAGTAGTHLQGGTGAWGTIDGRRVLPPNPIYAVSGTRNTDGTGDYFATMHSSFVASRGLAGWSGLRVYERPGYVKLGTTNDPGYLRTPPLTNIQGWADIRVKFSAARWSENTTLDANATVTVRIQNAGTSDQAGQEISLTPSWADKEIIVERATAETVIEFSTRDVANGRFLLDNIEISKVIR